MESHHNDAEYSGTYSINFATLVGFLFTENEALIELKKEVENGRILIPKDKDQKHSIIGDWVQRGADLYVKHNFCPNLSYYPGTDDSREKQKEYCVKFLNAIFPVHAQALYETYSQAPSSQVPLILACGLKSDDLNPVTIGMKPTKTDVYEENGKLFLEYFYEANAITNVNQDKLGALGAYSVKYSLEQDEETKEWGFLLNTIITKDQVVSDMLQGKQYTPAQIQFIKELEELQGEKEIEIQKSKQSLVDWTRFYQYRPRETQEVTAKLIASLRGELTKPFTPAERKIAQETELGKIIKKFQKLLPANFSPKVETPITSPAPPTRKYSK